MSKGVTNHNCVPDKGSAGDISNLKNVLGHILGVRDVPRLTYTPNNFQAFKSALAVNVTQVFGDLGSYVIRNSEYPVYPRKTKIGANTQIADMKEIEEADRRLARIADLRDAEDSANHRRLFATIWGYISKQSEDRIKLHADWANNDIDTTNDPLALWKVIVATHSSEVTGVAGIDRVNAHQRYEKCRQGASETLVEYKGRFDNAIRGLTALNIIKPSDEDQATRFFIGLDDSRYGPYKASLQNDIVNGYGKFPTSLSDAYEKAARQVAAIPRKGSNTNDISSLFLTTVDSIGKGKQSKDKKYDKSPQKSPEKKTRQQLQKKDSSNNEKKRVSNSNSPKKPLICFLCGLAGHGMSKCPRLDDAKQALSGGNRNQGVIPVHFTNSDGLSDENGIITTNDAFPNIFVTTICLAKECKNIHLGKYDVLLDNEASDSLFHARELLTNIHEVPNFVRIGGVGGEVFSTNLAGIFEPLNLKVWFHPKAAANILCFGVVEHSFPVKYYQNKCFKVIAENNTLTWNKTIADPSTGKGLYVANFEGLANARESHSFVTTVKQNIANAPPKVVKGARSAMELERRLGFPGRAALANVVRNGVFLNSPITTSDVYHAEQIFGRSEASLRGKTKTTQAPEVKIEYVPTPEVKTQQLHCDLMFVGGDPYLVSVSTPLHLILANPIKSKETKDISAALMIHINAYSSRGFKVTSILCDGEGGLLALQTTLNGLGIILNPTGAGSHVPVVENAIRRIKERIRSIITSLPYQLPHHLLQYLVSFAVSRINMMPTSSRGDLVSPREAFLGRKTNVKVDLRAGFGDYVHVVKPSTTNSNAVDLKRTEEAIALSSTGNVQGSVAFYSFASKSIIVRDKWYSVPMPEWAIQYLNNLAAQQSKQVKSNITFGIGYDATDLEDQPPHDVTVEETVEISPQTLSQHLPPTIIPETIVVSSPSPESNSPVEEVEVVEDTPHMQENFTDTADITTSTQEHSINNLDLNVNDMLPEHQPRRSSRTTAGQHPFRDDNYQYFHHLSARRAIKECGTDAMVAIMQEFQQMLDKKVFTPVHMKDIPKEHYNKILRSNMHVKYKYKSTGEFDKCKARFCAGGDRQDRSLYPDVSSPTVTLMSVFLIATIAASDRRKVTTLDIGGAYLNAAIQEIVYLAIEPVLASFLVSLCPSMELYLRPDGSIIVKLLRALYGCIESARLWFEHFKKSLLKFGFKENSSDKCVFNVTKNNVQCTVCIYVDDLFITCKDQSLINELVEFLKKEFVEIKLCEGNVHSYLGMTFNFNKPGKVKVTMEGYIRNILAEYEVKGKASTPALPDLFVVDDSLPLLPMKEQEEFRSRVAKFNYLVLRVRPEFAPLISFLASRVMKATQADVDKLNRGLRHLNYEPDLGIVLCADSTSPRITAYIDASWGVHPDAKSHSGMAITLGQGPVFISSGKQKIVAKSSTEAELIALSDGLSQVIWARDFIQYQGYSYNPAAIIFQDNQSTILLAEHGRNNKSQSKHINIRYFFIKEKIESKEVELVYLETKKMIADLLTKAVQGNLYRTLRGKLLNMQSVKFGEVD